jgi:hypothetical protein
MHDPTSANTAFTKLAKMNVVETHRECLERYMKYPRLGRSESSG